MEESSNPILNHKSFNKATALSASEGYMTVNGTVQKTGILTVLVVFSAIWSWTNPSSTWMIVGAIGGLITGLITAFKPNAAPITAPIYATFQGLFLGGISLLFETQMGMNGIVMQTITLTFGVLFLMLFLYQSGAIKVTDKLRMGVVAATGGIMVMYLLNFILSFFNAAFFTMADTSLMAIGINLVIVGVAAFNLLLDFDFIDRATKSGAPKGMEWYAAFGLMVTLIWLYLELLKLLSRLNRR